jgi:hypothetical protein
VKCGYVGIKEWKPNTRVTFVNGINNTYEVCIDIASIISGYHKYNKIHFICDETQGKVRDIQDAASLMILHQTSEAVDKLVYVWLQLFKEMNEQTNSDCQIITYAWSRGGLVTKLALEKLPPRLREKMVVYTFGTPAIIDSKVKQIKQFTNTNDYVPLLNPRRWLYAVAVLPHPDDTELLSKNDRGLDHNIIGYTYLPEIEKIGKQFYSNQPI